MAVSIEWFGLSSVRLTTKTQNTEVTIVTDPPVQGLPSALRLRLEERTHQGLERPEAGSTGIKLPRNLAADIVLINKNEASYNNMEAIGGTPFVITNPGEYEIKNVFVYGLKNGDGQTVYVLEIDDVVIMHLGGIKKLSAEVLERAEHVDILLIPVGGGDVLDAKQAGVLANEIQPRVVIPIHYKTKDSKGSLDGVEKFLKEMGAQKAETMNKIKLSKKDLPQEEMKVMVLTNE